MPDRSIKPKLILNAVEQTKQHWQGSIKDGCEMDPNPYCALNLL